MGWLFLIEVVKKILKSVNGNQRYCKKIKVAQCVFWNRAHTLAAETVASQVESRTQPVGHK